MKILVIGGTGLMSTEITAQLLERGDEVWHFNRGQTPARFKGCVQSIRGDRWQYPAFEAAMQGRSFDAVIDMVAFHPDNIRAVLKALKGRMGQLVVCSTVCVYGGPLTKLPATADEPHRFVSEYGRNKSAIEDVALAEDGKDGLRTTVIRPSFTTGEGHTASGLLFDDGTVDRLRRGLPVIIMDDGKAAWAIAHASDVARGFVASLGNAKAYGQAYHLTSDEHTDWNGVFQALAQAAGAKAPLLCHVPSDWLYGQAPRRSVGIQYIYKYPSIFDNSKARADLGFATTVPLVETFRRQIKWMEAEGKLLRAEEEPVQSVLYEAYLKGTVPAPGSFVDFNPWGNQVTN